MLIASASYRVNLFNRLNPKGDQHLISPYSNSGARRDQAKKIWMYDRTTAQGATFNMRGQLYRGHGNATAFSSSPVVSAQGSESDDPVSSPGRGKALCP